MTNHPLHPQQDASSSTPAESGSRPLDGMFRREAVDDHAGLDTRGELLNLSNRWSHWTPWLLLAMLGSIVVFLSLVRGSEFATGPARVFRTPKGLSVVVTIPATFRTRVHGGNRLLLHHGTPPGTLELPVTSASEPARASGGDGVATEDQSTLEVTAECARGECAAFEQLAGFPATGAASVSVGSTPLLLAVFPRLRGLVRLGSP